MNLRLSLIGSARPGSHLFGPDGGAFGRSQKCDWVLPDDERILSSVHGRLVFKSGEFMLVDESTNGIFVNGLPEPLGRGNSIVLSNGTRFNAGRYVIEAHLVPVERFDPPQRQAASTSARSAAPPSPYHDPHAVRAIGGSADRALHDRTELGSLWVQNSQDPLSYMDDAVDAGIGGSLDRMEHGREPLSLSRHAVDPLQSLSYGHEGQGERQAYPSPVGFDRNNERPGGAFSNDAASFHDPLRMLGHEPMAPAPARAVNLSLLPQSVQPSQAVAQPPSPGQGPAVIPDDFFASLATPRKARGGQHAATDLQSRLATQATSQPSIQPPASMARIPDGFDPFAPKQAQQVARPALAAPLTPAPQPIAPQELHTTVANSVAQPDKALATRPNGLSPALMADMVEFSTPKEGSAQPASRADGPLDALEAMKARREQRKAVMLKKAQSGSVSLPLPSGPTMPSLPSAVFPATGPLPSAGPVPAEEARVPRPTGRADSAADSALVSAFLEGMGFAGAELHQAEHDRFMREAGAMVRSMAAGLILLLSARKMVKSEFRMDETQVQPEENNPFKFFKVAELALDEMFVARKGGFQAPPEAARSAFEDLEQHTLLTMSAMQRAIKLIFERLSPDILTGDADDQGGLRIRGLGSRKSKLEAFVEGHERMSRNIDNIARQVIGEAFAQVQEEQARKRSKEHWEKKR